jgi:hypothetical protein
MSRLADAVSKASSAAETPQRVRNADTLAMQRQIVAAAVCGTHFMPLADQGAQRTGF